MTTGENTVGTSGGLTLHSGGGGQGRPLLQTEAKGKASKRCGNDKIAASQRIRLSQEAFGVGSQSFTTGEEKLPNLPNLPKCGNGFFGDLVRFEYERVVRIVNRLHSLASARLGFARYRKRQRFAADYGGGAAGLSREYRVWRLV
jgi:hypothetical protein